MASALETLGRALEGYISSGSVLAIVFAFLFGVFVGFTPCIYPLLPITVAYIGSISRGRKINGFLYSLMYVAGMAVVYCTMGILTAVFGGLIGEIWGNGWVLLALANFFILLALWQLKVIRIPVPQFIKGGGRRGGMLGALAVGAASGLVVGPCTLPGLAAMLTLIAAGAEEGSIGSLLFGGLAMLAYSIGLGSLVLICGTFSGFLAALPKSGRWLSVIEKTFAILLILAAEFFLIYLGQNANFPMLSSVINLGAS